MKRWLRVGATLLVTSAAIAYVVAVLRTPAPDLGEATAASRRWFWF